MRILRRADWSPQFGTGPAGPATRSLVIVHHWYRPNVGSVSRARERELLRQVEHAHAMTFWTAANRSRARIGYNLVPFDSGRVYEGCGLTTVGAHTAGHNTPAFGVAFPIDGDARLPSDAAFAGAAAAIRELQDRGVLARSLTVTGHRDHGSTRCPGGRLYPQRRRLLSTLTPVEEDDMVADWARAARDWVRSLKISDGQRPGDPVTRQEAWVMLHNYHRRAVKGGVEHAEALKQQMEGMGSNPGYVREIIRHLRG